MIYDICTRCTPNHYENCGSCFGFGVRMVSKSPIAADHARILRQLDDTTGYCKACLECGSTVNGVPKAVTA